MNLIKLSEYFEIKYGVNLEFQNMKLCSKGIPFVSRTEKNNGIVGFVEIIDSIKPNPKNTISVACGGSVMESFLQKNDYYSGRDLFYLKPKMVLTDIEMLFYCMCLRANKYRYSYGRQANKTLNDLLVPSINSIPIWVYNQHCIEKPDDKKFHNKQMRLGDRTWNYFEVNSLFSKIEKAKCNNASLLLTEGDDIFYIGAKKKDNGVMNKVKLVENIVSKGNAIVLIGDGQGSVGYALYQPIDFIGSTTLTIGYNEKLNKYNAMFIVTVLDLERYRYSFGRKYGKSTGKAKIKLPSTAEGKIDWEYMENYIKSLPYSAFL